MRPCIPINNARPLNPWSLATERTQERDLRGVSNYILIMIAVPFIYFSTITLIIYLRKKTIDISVFIALLYAISGFFSILMDKYNLWLHGSIGYSISPISSFCYCFLLSLNLIPFIFYSNNRIKEIKQLNSSRALKIICHISLIWFICLIFITKESFLEVFSGNIISLRSAVYGGYAVDNFASLPKGLSIILTVLNMLFSCAWIQVFLAFYCFLVQKMNVKYFFAFLLTSLSSIWNSILGIDRSGVAYYLIIFIAIFIFFRPIMDHKQKKFIYRTVVLLFCGCFIYLGFMTISRFSGGSIENGDLIGGSLYIYLGENYVNFCYLFDTFDNPEKTLNLIFPLTARYVFGSHLVSGVVLQEYIGMKTGCELGIFYTYLGQIMITGGHFVMILFSAFYTAVSFFFFYKKRRKITMFLAYIYMWLASFMILGMYVYYYSSPSRNLSFLFFFFLIYFATNHKISDSRSLYK